MTSRIGLREVLRRVAPAMVLWLAIGHAAVAEEEKEKPDPVDAAYEACIEKDPSTAGMLDCAGEAEAAWDAELNAAYKALSAELKDEALEALKQAQRAWIAQRDREYALQEEVLRQLQGTMWGPVMSDQRVTIVKNRTLQLRALKSFLDEGRP
jgi:uncharacterized protein YecT (DUF1311 family)